MGRLQRIAASVAILSIGVIIISLVASKILRPNQVTPVTQILPSKTQALILPKDKTLAAWVWKSPTEITEQAQMMVDFASAEGINTLYLYIDEYLDIYEMPKSQEKQTKLSNYYNSVKNIISLAKAKNISVHALSGNTNYSYDSHTYIPPIILESIFEFNEKNPDTIFEGIQFDIEFYEDPRFFGSTKEYINEYLKLINDLTQQTKKLNQKYASDVSLGFVIPFWFDSANEYMDSPILGDIINFLSDLSNCYLIVMSYRNEIEKDGGVLDISKKELEAAAGTSVKVIIAQELVENKETKITHFGKSKAQIKSDFLKIMEKASAYPSFEGISIHDLTAFMETR